MGEKNKKPQLDPFPFCIKNNIIYFSQLENNGNFKCEKGETFYAIVPNYTPIPTGMGLICIENDGTGIISVKFERDPNFITLKDCVSMIVWPTPVPNTIPLYFYQGEKYYIPSLEKLDLPEIQISPLYVLKDDNIGFSCYQGYRCLPDKNSKISLTKCVVDCNQQDPVNIYQYALQGENVKKPRVGNIPLALLILIYIAIFLGGIYIYFKIIRY